MAGVGREEEQQPRSDDEWRENEKMTEGRRMRQKKSFG